MKKNNKFQWWMILVIIGFILMIIGPIATIGIFAYMDINKPGLVEENNVTRVGKGEITVEKVTSFYDEKSNKYYITGDLINHSDKDYEGIDVEFLVYDKSSNILGNAYANINVLSRKKTWKFKAIYEDIDAKDVTSYELNSVNFY